MPKIMRERSRIMAIVSQLITRRMPQHMGMNREGELSRLARALNHSQKPRRSHWRSALSDKHIWARPLQWPQRPKLRTMQRVNAFNPALGSVHVQSTIPEIDLRPTKLTELSSTQSVPIRE